MQSARNCKDNAIDLSTSIWEAAKRERKGGLGDERNPHPLLCRRVRPIVSHPLLRRLTWCLLSHWVGGMGCYASEAATAPLQTWDLYVMHVTNYLITKLSKWETPQAEISYSPMLEPHRKVIFMKVCRDLIYKHDVSQYDAKEPMSSQSVFTNWEGYGFGTAKSATKRDGDMGGSWRRQE